MQNLNAFLSYFLHTTQKVWWQVAAISLVVGLPGDVLSSYIQMNVWALTIQNAFLLGQVLHWAFWSVGVVLIFAHLQELETGHAPSPQRLWSATFRQGLGRLPTMWGARLLSLAVITAFCVLIGRLVAIPIELLFTSGIAYTTIRLIILTLLLAALLLPVYTIVATKMVFAESAVMMRGDGCFRALERSWETTEKRFTEVYLYLTLAHYIAAAAAIPLLSLIFWVTEIIPELSEPQYWMATALMEWPANVIIGFLVVYQYCLYKYKWWLDLNPGRAFRFDEFEAKSTSHPAADT